MTVTIKRFALLPAILIIGSSLGGCDALNSINPLQPNYLTRDKVPQLQSMASKACECARKGSSDDYQACWQEFDKRIDGYVRYEGASACDAGSVSFVEFVQPNGDESDYPIVYRDFGYGACTAEEKMERFAESEAAGERSC